MSGKHTSQHHKISSSSKSFGYITRIGTSTISHHMSSYTMSSICTLYHSRELGVSYTSLYPSSTYGARSYTYFDYIRSFQYQLFCDLFGNNVAGYDDLIWIFGSDICYSCYKSLGITIGHIYTYPFYPISLGHDSIKFL